MYFSIFAIIFASATALPYAVEPMVISCSIGPSALECYKRFGTTCDVDCNIIHPAPMSIANGSCSDRTCACVDINALNGIDESGLAISTYSSKHPATHSATKTDLRVGKETGTTKVTGSAPTGDCYHHHHYHHHHQNGTKSNTTASTTHHHALNCTHKTYTHRGNATGTATHHHILNGTMTIHPFNIKSTTVLVTGAMFDETSTSTPTSY